MPHSTRSRLEDVNVPFDDDLEDEVLRSDDDDAFIAALERPDCPATLAVDLFQALNPEVRRKVAAHPSTPLSTLRRMTTDPDPVVSRIASRRVS